MKPLLYSVLPRPAHPTRDGLAIRNYHLLAGLAGEFRVRAAALVPPHLEGSGEYPPGVEVEEVRQGARAVRRAGALVRSAFSGDAYPALLYRSRRLSSLLRDWTTRERPKWIVAHSYHVAPAAAGREAPAWVDFHNVDSEIWRRMGEDAVSGLERALARWQAPRVERCERGILARASGVSCVSERDARALLSLGARSPGVVPNGVDLSRYRFREEPAASEMVFFVGDLSWPPNAAGIRWFSAEIWPEIARLRPGASAEILGRGAPRGLTGRAPSGVSFVGGGEDTRSFWSRAAVAVVPLRAGGGTRLKILEAAACGVPVVSTPVGAEGLDFVPGREISVAAGTREFAGAVARLLADHEASRSQAAAARARVEKDHDWRSIGRDFARRLSGQAPVRA
jgi:glycosyltransferase involved in cell wall biosynthesis